MGDNSLASTALALASELSPTEPGHYVYAEVDNSLASTALALASAIRARAAPRRHSGLLVANPRVTGRVVSAGMVFIGVSKFLFKQTGLFVFSTFSTLLTHEIALRYKSPVEFGANKAGHPRNQSITWSKTGRLLNQREIPLNHEEKDETLLIEGLRVWSKLSISACRYTLQRGH